VRYEMAHCYRCGYSWFPRRPRVHICSRCKSPYFDLPKLRVPSYGGGFGVEEVIGGKRTRILRLATRFGATNVRVFGSVARRQATAASDVDLLVDPVGHRFRPVELGLALKELLGRPVDVVTERGLPWYIQPNIVVEAVPL